MIYSFVVASHPAALVVRCPQECRRAAYKRGTASLCRVVVVTQRQCSFLLSGP